MSPNNQFISSLDIDFENVADVDKDAKELAINNYLAILKLNDSFIQISQDLSNVIERINNIDNSFNNIQNDNLKLKEFLNNIELSGNYDLSNTPLILYYLSNNFYDLNNNFYDLSNNFYDLSNNFYDLLVSPQILNDFSNYNTTIIESLLNDTSNINGVLLDFSNSRLSNIDSNINNILLDISNIYVFINDLSLNTNTDISQNNLFLLDLINDVSNELFNTKHNFFAMASLIRGDVIIANSNINYNHEKILLIENTIYKLDDELNKTFVNISNKINNIEANVNILENSITEISNNSLKKNDELIENIFNNNNFVKSDLLISNSNIDFCEENIILLHDSINNINNKLKILNSTLNANTLEQSNLKRNLSDLFLKIKQVTNNFYDYSNNTISVINIDNDLKINTPTLKDLSNIIYKNVNVINNDELIINININYTCCVEFKQRINLFFYIVNSLNTEIINFEKLGTLNSSGNEGYTGNFHYNWIIQKNIIDKFIGNNNSTNVKFYMKFSIENNNLRQIFKNINGPIFLGINNVTIMVHKYNSSIFN